MRNKVNPGVLGGLPVVFGLQDKPTKKWWLKRKKKKLVRVKKYFFFSEIVFNSLFLFKKLAKRRNNPLKGLKLKQSLVLIHRMFLKKTRYKGFAIKRVKGGFITSALGYKSFMPRSHSKRLLRTAPMEWFLGLRLQFRRKRFSAKKFFINLNVISSSKPQGKSARLIHNQRYRGRGSFWGPLASAVNKRIDNERGLFTRARPKSVGK